MTDNDALITNAGLQLFAHPDIHVQLSIVTAVAIIGQLQLACRHPENTGQSRMVVVNFLRDLIETIDPSHGDAYRLLMMGFDPAHDE